MCADQQFWLNWYLNLAIAIATFFAVIVALFGDNIKVFFFPLKLKIRLRNSIGEFTFIVSKANAFGKELEMEQNARYFHLVISNKAKYSISNQTQVFLQRIEQLNEDGKIEIKWTGEVPMQWMHQSIYPIARTIGQDAICDLCYVTDRFFKLLPIISPNNLATEYHSSTIILTLQAKGNEGVSPILKIKIEWDGIWDRDDTEMSKHFIIKDITNDKKLISTLIFPIS